MSTHTATTRPTSIVRRLALLALGLMVVLTGVGLGGSPASADAPNTPAKIIAKSYDDYIRLYWAPANISDPATSYRIERRVQSTDVWSKAWTVANAKAFVDTTAEPNYTYVYRVRAQNADGNSAWSQDFIGKLDQSAPNDFYMFQSAESFAIRQYKDFLGTNLGQGPASQIGLNLKNGTLTATSFIDGLVNRPERAHRHQIIRLYNAYFGRTADVGGLHFWSEQITEHGKSINTVSNSFAASKEFKDMYGNLTNAQFVTLVYQNVLDRNPSASDLSYWKGELDKGKVTRGKVMTQFSESVEYKALSRGRVLSADVHEAMTGAAIGDASLATFGRHIQGGGTAGDYALAIVLQNSYDAI